MIWLDLTLLLQWDRPPVGLVRTELELAKQSLVFRNVRYVRFSPGSTGPINVPQDLVISKIRFFERFDANSQIGSIFSDEHAGAQQLDPKGDSTSSAGRLAIEEYATKARQLTRKAIRDRVESWSALPRLITMFVLVPLNFALRFFMSGLHTAVDFSQQAAARIRAEWIGYKAEMEMNARSFSVELDAQPQPSITELLLSPNCEPGCSWGLFGMNSVLVSVGNNWDYMLHREIFLEKRRHQFKYVGFCYDLVPIRVPHLAMDGYKDKFEEHFADMLWSADKILCISENSKFDLENFKRDRSILASPEIKTLELGGGVTTKPSFGNLPEWANQQKFILYVSTIERRKNHETAYRAFLSLVQELGVDRTPILIFVGMPGWHVSDLLREISMNPEIIDSNGFARLQVLSEASDAELAWLYKNALFTIYPSFYEGWGLPIVECLSLGVPVVSSNSSSLIEAAQGKAIHLDPLDVMAWKNEMSKLITSPKYLEEARDKAREFRGRTWVNFAEHFFSEIGPLIEAKP